MKFTKKRLLEILTENIEEMAMDFETGDRPDQGIQDKLKNKETTFKKVPLPNTGNEENQNFQELLASERYKQVISKMRQYTGIETEVNGMNGVMPLMQTMMMAHNQIVQIERTKREELERLAIELVIKEMAIPEGSLQFDAKIVGVGEVDTENFNREMEENPENDAVEIEEDLMDELEQFDFEKAKRRLVNSIIQGASKKGHYMFHAVEDRLTQITGNPNIINLYGVMMSVNDTMYWQLSDETVKQMSGGEGESVAGKEEVDRNTNPPTIRARGVNFPVLVHELIKGVMELFAVHGRPTDDEGFEETEKEDTMEKEVWDLRLGPAIWERIRGQFPEEILIDENQIELQNYLLMEIFKLPAKNFLVFMKEVLSGTDRGKLLIGGLLEGIQKVFDEGGYDEGENNGEFREQLEGYTDDTDNDNLNDYLNDLGIEPYNGD